MDNSDTLFRQLKPDIERISEPLFEFAQQQVHRRGAYLPFGASLSRDGEVALAAATGEQDRASSSEILPLLHEGLRETAERGDVLAVAVCEWVRVARNAGRETDAIKVLVEHQKGLTVALYMPCQKKIFRG